MPEMHRVMKNHFFRFADCDSSSISLSFAVRARWSRMPGICIGCLWKRMALQGCEVYSLFLKCSPRFIATSLWSGRPPDWGSIARLRLECDVSPLQHVRWSGLCRRVERRHLVISWFSLRRWIPEANHWSLDWRSLLLVCGSQWCQLRTSSVWASTSSAYQFWFDAIDEFCSQSLADFSKALRLRGARHQAMDRRTRFLRSQKFLWLTAASLTAKNARINPLNRLILVRNIRILIIFIVGCCSLGPYRWSAFFESLELSSQAVLISQADWQQIYWTAPHFLGESAVSVWL